MRAKKRGGRLLARALQSADRRRLETANDQFRHGTPVGAVSPAREQKYGCSTSVISRLSASSSMSQSFASASRDGSKDRLSAADSISYCDHRIEPSFSARDVPEPRRRR